MIAAVALEQPFNLHDVFEEAFLKLKRLWNVEEQPVRITKEPVAWVRDKSDPRNRPVGVVLPVSNGKFIYFSLEGMPPRYDEAYYIKNFTLHPAPNSSARKTIVSDDLFVWEKYEPTVEGQENVIEKEPISPDMQKLLRTAMRAKTSAPCSDAKPV